MCVVLLKIKIIIQHNLHKENKVIASKSTTMQLQ